MDRAVGKENPVPRRAAAARTAPLPPFRQMAGKACPIIGDILPERAMAWRCLSAGT